MKITIFILITLILGLIWIYNRFIQLKKRSEAAWADIDVQLKRRYDLIPNIVSSVKAYQTYEKKILEDITALRSSTLGTATRHDKIQTENQLGNSLKTLFALAEKYPDLKANQNFLSLHNTLTDIENHLQGARRYYNAVVRDFNTWCESFPSNILANFFHFVSLEYFNLDNLNERNATEVKLD